MVRAKVAVVGAGAAGLAAARELRNEGHTVEVFEQGGEVGGVWVYNEEIEDDLLGISEARKQVHSSMYAQLRTNLPREVMGFSDFWFGEPFVDGRRFCGHQEVKLYVEAFAQHFDLHPLLRLNTRVLTASPVTAAAPALGPAWEVTTQAGGEKPVRQTYDALVVCNGHYSQPRLPQVEGESDFPGLILHSHSYRQKEVFAGQRVVVVGASASGEDIAREVAETAQEVYLSARSWQNPEWATDPNPIGRLWRRPMIRELCADGSAVFTNGETVCGVDTVIYCTGYTYSFPFLAAGETVTVQDNCISPLYEHVFPPQAPTLSFIGVPWKVVPFPMFELQSKWVAQVLSRRVSLPGLDDMVAAAAEAEAHTPRRHAHCLGDAQFAYNDRLAAACGVEPLPDWRRAMYSATGLNKRSRPESYRDEWSDEEMRAPARHTEEQGNRIRP